MLTPVAHTIQLPEETQPETAPAKAKGKAASQAACSDFSQFMCQFLGAVAQSTQQTDQELTTDAGAPAGAAQPAPQPVPQPASQPAADASVTLPENAALFPGVNGPDAMAVKNAETAAPQPAADASVTLHENAALLLGVNAPDAPAVEGAETTSLSIAAPGSLDKASLAGTSGSEDAVIPVANDKAAAPIAVGADQQPSHNTGYPQKQEKPDLHKLLAKQEPSGVVVDESKTGEPADTGRSNTLRADGDFSTVMHQESSGVQNVQAQISGATIPHRTHEGNGSVPVHAANAADALDTAPTIVKDGNRLAVKFEQDGLGKLDIDLRLNKGMINAHFQAADDTTKTLIENNMQQIVDSLLKAGLSVGGFSVSLKGGGQQNMTRDEYHGKTEQAAGGTGTVAALAPRVASNSLVSIFI